MMLADSLPLRDVVEDLRTSRTLYHSEADLQHAFAMTVARLAPDLLVRLEVPFRSDQRSEYVDLVVTDPVRKRSTAVEFKYFTAGLTATDPRTGEQFHLRAHSAADLARLHFLRDVRRLERFTSPSRTGIALILTNASSLWTSSTRRTRDREFRIHDGQRLSGTLAWGSEGHAPNQLTLAGVYEMAWHPYSDLDRPRGEFRWLALEIPAPEAPRS